MVVLFLIFSIALILLEGVKIASKHKVFDLPQRSYDQEFPLSVVVCYRNEVDNVKRLLQALRAQSHLNFELIVIDDFSDLDQKVPFQWLDKTPFRIRYIELETYCKTHKGKKQAVWFGVSKANHDWVVHTDADCVPKSKEWLHTIAKELRQKNNKKEIYIGYGAYQKLPGLLNKLIRFDTALIAADYFFWNQMGFAYSAVGRNLIYHKDVLLDNPQIVVPELDSGDDDLLVEKQGDIPINNLTDPLSFTLSIPPKTLKNWIKQKARHLTTASYYSWVSKTISFLNFHLKLFWWMFFLGIALTNTLTGLVFLTFILRVSTGFFFYKSYFKSLKENDLQHFALIFEFLVILFYPIFWGMKFLPWHKRQ